MQGRQMRRTLGVLLAACGCLVWHSGGAHADCLKTASPKTVNTPATSFFRAPIPSETQALYNI